jgi:predicted metalloendopeptidase
MTPSADPKNNKETIVSANQGGLGLPDREYYLKTDARSEICDASTSSTSHVPWSSSESPRLNRRVMPIT